MESSKNSIDYLFESYDSQTKFIEHFIDSFSKYDEKTIIEKIKSFEKIIEIFHFPFSLLLNNDSIQNNLAFACYTNQKIKESVISLFVSIYESLAFIPSFDIEFPIFDSMNEFLNIQIKYNTRVPKTEQEKIYLDTLNFKSIIKRYNKKINNLGTANPLDEVELKNISDFCTDLSQFINQKLSILQNDGYLNGFFSLEKNELLTGRFILLDYYNNIKGLNKKDITSILNDRKIVSNSNQVKINEINDNNQISNYINLKDKTFFYLNEKILESEGIQIEYKLYTYPLSKELRYGITKQICGFLNAKGGRIFFGINDNSEVKGMYIEEKQRDLFRNELFNSTIDFYPSCRINKLEVYYLPIFNKSTNSYCENLFVTKLVIKQGDIGRLYSMEKDCFKACMRMPGQVVFLNASEINEQILKRLKGELLYSKVEDSEYNDPPPIIPEST